MKEIANIPLTPLGDVICCINQLEHLKKIYAPCRVTVFAIPLIAELMKNSVWVDEVIVLNGGDGLPSARRVQSWHHMLFPPQAKVCRLFE